LHKLEDIPPKFDNELFRPLFEVAEIAKFTDEELRNYEARMKYVDDYNATIEYAKKETRIETRKETLWETACKMKAKGSNTSFISEITGISVADIEKI
jgi:predicted transposase/invertase (TIGR01784 family)